MDCHLLFVRVAVDYCASTNAPYGSAEPCLCCMDVGGFGAYAPIMAEPFKSREHRRDVSREEFEAFLLSYARPLEAQTPLNT